MSYIDQFTPWYQGVDRSTDEVEDPYSVLEDDLYPYLIGGNTHPLSHVAMKGRVGLVDRVIVKNLKSVWNAV